jgi:hypothetical protein
LYTGNINPIGVGVVIECRHLCMSMRGVQKQNSVTTTSAFTGEFLKEKTRTEFLNLISSKLVNFGVQESNGIKKSGFALYTLDLTSQITITQSLTQY